MDGYSPNDLDAYARTVATEANPNDPQGMLAVANVIANRVASGQYGNTPSAVVRAPDQFEVWQNGRAAEVDPQSSQYQQALQAIRAVTSGQANDNTGGATHFYSPSGQAALGRNTPKWAAGKPLAFVGGQAFYAPNGTVNRAMPVADDFLKDFPVVAPTQAQAAATSSSIAPMKPAGQSAIPDFLQDFAIVPPPSAVSASKPSVSPATQEQQAEDEGYTALKARAGAPPAPAPNPMEGGFDPHASVGQQAAYIAQHAKDYVLGQAGGVLPAVQQDFSAANALRQSGIADLSGGNILPSFPSADPATWGAGGALKTVAGLTGALYSPVSGVVRKAVEEPATAEFGPDVGARAGLVANTVLSPLLARGISGTTNALADATIGRLDPETARLATLARDQYGIPVNAAQMSASPSVRFLSSTLNRLPFSGAPAEYAQTQNAVNRAVSMSIGENATKLTPDVMKAAKSRIGNVFDQVAQNTTVGVDRQFLQDIHNTLNNAQVVLPKQEAEPLFKATSNILSKIDPNTKTISGETYQALTRTGTPLDRLLNSSNPNLAYYSQGLRNALDDALERSASPEMANALSQAKYQYRNLMTIKPLVAKAPTGDINPALLQGAVNQKTGNALAFGGGGELGDIARIGQRFLKEPPSSGTAERLNAMNMFSNLAAAPLTVPGGFLGNALLARGLRSNALAKAMLQRSIAPAGEAPSALFPLSISGLGLPASLNKPVNALAAPNQ